MVNKELTGAAGRKALVTRLNAVAGRKATKWRKSGPSDLSASGCLKAGRTATCSLRVLPINPPATEPDTSDSAALRGGDNSRRWKGAKRGADRPLHPLRTGISRVGIYSCLDAGQGRHGGVLVLSHTRIWSAIDRLAERNKLSASALARRAGLDPTQLQQIQTHLARRPPALALDRVDIQDPRRHRQRDRRLPRPGRAAREPPSAAPGAAAGVGAGRRWRLLRRRRLPAGQGWDEIAFPANGNDNVFALEVSGDSMLPLYRDGDTIIVQRDAQCRKGGPRRRQDQRGRGGWPRC